MYAIRSYYGGGRDRFSLRAPLGFSGLRRLEEGRRGLEGSIDQDALDRLPLGEVGQEVLHRGFDDLQGKARSEAERNNFV